LHYADKSLLPVRNYLIRAFSPSFNINAPLMSEDWSTVNYRDGGKHWNELKREKK